MVTDVASWNAGMGRNEVGFLLGDQVSAEAAITMAADICVSSQRIDVLLARPYAVRGDEDAIQGMALIMYRNGEALDDGTVLVLNPMRVSDLAAVAQREEAEVANKGYLDPKYRLRLRCIRDAHASLPQISQEDCKSRSRRIRLLLGQITDPSDDAECVVIEHVAVVDDAAVIDESTSVIDVAKFSRWVKGYLDRNRGLDGLSLVGLLITMPQTDFKGPFNSWEPSQSIQTALYEWYRDGHVPADYPFILAGGFYLTESLYQSSGEHAYFKIHQE